MSAVMERAVFPDVSRPELDGAPAEAFLAIRCFSSAVTNPSGKRMLCFAKDPSVLRNVSREVLSELVNAFQDDRGLRGPGKGCAEAVFGYLLARGIAKDRLASLCTCPPTTLDSRS